MTIEIACHSVAEEVLVYPQVASEISEDDLRQLGSRVEAFKKVAPTRPHPNVPNEALPRLAAGTVASLLDRFRDPASGRGTG